jgi:hypothetical protein
VKTVLVGINNINYPLGWHGSAHPVNRVFCLPASPKLAGKNLQAGQGAGLSGGKTISSGSFLRRKLLCLCMREGGFFVIRGCSKTSVFGTGSLNVGCFTSLKSLLLKDLRLRNSIASGKTMGFWNWHITHETFSKHQFLGRSPFSHKNRFLEVQSEIIC